MVNEYLLTIGQLAKRLNVHRDSIRRWVRAGVIPCIRITNRTVRFDFDEVTRAIRKDVDNEQ